ncbi:MAG TPA: asparagine synthase (glutamine-hydrolyzing) [Saprospiraceae bacterium]|nr:asparagine synthase (glutamine-hydrolyzing) [Saprospiraceae bacterium]
MCGLIGTYNLEINKDNLLEIISHRGPDDRGFFISDNLFLAHVRLAIQDLSESAHQPMISADEKYVLIYNGEIYNHLELRALLDPDLQYRSNGDTETLLHLLIQFGEGILEKLNGIFAFAFYNRKTEELILARDQFGIKPLYIFKTEQQLAFSSELKTLTAISGIDYEINSNALAKYIQYLYSPGEETPFKNILKFKPGHYLKIDLTNITKFDYKSFYKIPFCGIIVEKSEKQWIKEIDEALSLAIERQLLSDAPIGYFLSGGLDSSLIVAIASKMSPSKKLECFTINSGTSDVDGFEDDLQYARIVADQYQCNINIIDADSSFIEHIDEMLYYLDEPLADIAPLYVQNISKQASNHGIKVLLSGAGGDDVFSGYRRHQAIVRDHYFDIIPKTISNFLAKGFSHFSTTNPTIRRIRKVLALSSLDKHERMASYFEWIDPALTNSLFLPSKQIQLHNTRIEFLDKLNSIQSENNRLNQMLFLELSYFLKDHNLNYTDKMGMSTGVEIRVPFLDVDLVNLSTQLPPDLKLRNNQTKYILKKVAEKYLPKDVIYRPKTGFGAPLREWLTGPLADWLNKELSQENIRQLGIFDEQQIAQLIEANRTFKLDASYSLLALVMIHRYFKIFPLKSNS